MTCKRYFVLDGRKVREVTTMLEWAIAFETQSRRVASDDVGDGIVVSTVFVGALAGTAGTMFETMVWNDYGTIDSAKWDTYDEAEQGHATLVAKWREWVARAKGGEVEAPHGDPQD